MMLDPHERAFPDKWPMPYVVTCQNRMESAWETLTHICAGLGYQLVCEFLIAPALLMEPYHFGQAILNIAIYVPVRYLLGYGLRRKFVANLAHRAIPVPRTSEQALQEVLAADHLRFQAELELDEVKRERDSLRIELSALIGDDLTRTRRP